jgi:hypothetical protein
MKNPPVLLVGSGRGCTLPALYVVATSRKRASRCRRPANRGKGTSETWGFMSPQDEGTRRGLRHRVSFSAILIAPIKAAS